MGFKKCGGEFSPNILCMVLLYTFSLFAISTGLCYIIGVFADTSEKDVSDTSGVESEIIEHDFNNFGDYVEASRYNVVVNSEKIVGNELALEVSIKNTSNKVIDLDLSTLVGLYADNFLIANKESDCPDGVLADGMKVNFCVKYDLPDDWKVVKVVTSVDDSKANTVKYMKGNGFDAIKGYEDNLLKDMADLKAIKDSETKIELSKTE